MVMLAARWESPALNTECMGYGERCITGAMSRKLSLVVSQPNHSECISMLVQGETMLFNGGIVVSHEMLPFTMLVPWISGEQLH